MLKSVNFKKVTTIGLLAISMQTLGIGYSFANDTSTEDTPTPTGSLNPNTFTDTIAVGGTVSLDRTVTIGTIPDVVTTSTSTQDRKLDILFLADNTSSMGGAINNVKTNATDILTNLSDYGDVEFGVARYYSDPGDSKRCDGNWSSPGISVECDAQSDIKYGATDAYQLLKPIGTPDAEVIGDEGIGMWEADTSANGDWAEGNFFALHQAATNGATVNGYGTNANTGWRTDAEKIIVWFGDAHANTGVINQADTITALNDRGIKVIAIHVDSQVWYHKNQYGQYLSTVVGLDYNQEASTIASQTGGAYASADPEQLSNTIKSLVGSAVTTTTTTTNSAGTVDLTFQAQSDADISGINITYTCTDSLGCNDVKSGESRTFRMDVEGLAVGVYDFKTKVVGVDGAVGTDQISVMVFAD